MYLYLYIYIHLYNDMSDHTITDQNTSELSQEKFWNGDEGYAAFVNEGFQRSAGLEPRSLKLCWNLILAENTFRKKCLVKIWRFDLVFAEARPLSLGSFGCIAISRLRHDACRLGLSSCHVCRDLPSSCSRLTPLAVLVSGSTSGPSLRHKILVRYKADTPCMCVAGEAAGEALLRSQTTT